MANFNHVWLVEGLYPGEKEWEVFAYTEYTRKAALVRAAGVKDLFPNYKVRVVKYVAALPKRGRVK